jgi:hypothetical protein
LVDVGVDDPPEQLVNISVGAITIPASAIAPIVLIDFHFLSFIFHLYQLGYK